MAKADQKRKKSKARRIRRPRALKWVVGVGAVALLGYGVSRLPSIAYTDRDIKVVDFSALTSEEKRTALEAANRARCSCGCGLGLAECVATDSTCPIREDNIEKIKTMVVNARNRGG